MDTENGNLPAAVASPQPCKGKRCVRVVIGRVGAHRRAFVLENPPFPHVGDEINVKGDEKPWKVREVKETEYVAIIEFPPAAKLKRADYLAQGERLRPAAGKDGGN